MVIICATNYQVDNEIKYKQHFDNYSLIHETGQSPSILTESH